MKQKDKDATCHAALRLTAAPPPVIENTRADFLRAMQELEPFLSRSQRECVMSLARGEEKQFFFDKMVQLANIIAGMPFTYEQDGRGDDQIAYLHYFAGGCDWYITEKDKGDDEDEVKGLQQQAFGFANLGDPQNAELGYISIQELIDNQVELDFHFTPKTIAEIKRKDCPHNEMIEKVEGFECADCGYTYGRENPAYTAMVCERMNTYQTTREVVERAAKAFWTSNPEDDPTAYADSRLVRAALAPRTQFTLDDYLTFFASHPFAVNEPPAPVMGSGAEVHGS